jgi:uncharacterized LabA/DUF88 family protein
MSQAQRVSVLVDSENLEIAAEDMFGLRKSKQIVYPNWKVIIPEILSGRELVRLIYYKKASRTISDKFEALWREELGGEFKQPEKSVDPYIIIDAVTLCDKMDVIILLGGDKDYIPLIWYLKSRGCKVEVVGFPSSTAEIMKVSADRYHALNETHTISLKKTRK